MFYVFIQATTTANSKDSNDMTNDAIWLPPNSIKQAGIIRESKTNEISFKPNEKTFKTENHLTSLYGNGQYMLNTLSVPSPLQFQGPQPPPPPGHE